MEIFCLTLWSVTICTIKSFNANDFQKIKRVLNGMSKGLLSATALQAVKHKNSQNWIQKYADVSNPKSQ